MKPKIRCSELPRLFGCHGSRTLIPLVKQRSGGEGWEGTYGHWAVADRLMKECGAKTKDDRLPSPHENNGMPGNYALPKMSEWIVDWVLRQVAELIPPTYSLNVEDFFSWEFEDFILTGHMDICALSADATEFIGADEKWGYKPVDSAELNDQFLGYLVLAKCCYPTLKHAAFHGLQPRNSEEDGYQRVSSVELDEAGLLACVKSLEMRVKAALADPYTVETGLTQCAWCPVGIQCPAIQKELEFMKATLDPANLSIIKNIADDALLGDVIVASRVTNRAIEDAENLLHARLDDQPEVVAGCGTHITRKIEGGQFTIIDPEGAYAAVKSVVPEPRIPHVLKYSSDRLVDEIAKAMDIPKGGKAAVTGRSVFESTIRPFFEQRERRKLIFS